MPPGGVNAGTAYVDLKVDMSGFRKQLTDSVGTAAKDVGGGLGDKVKAGIGSASRFAVNVGGALSAAVIGFGAASFMAAARVQELDIAMDAVGKSSGYGAGQMHKAALAVKSQGIEAAAADKIVLQFAQAHLKLSDASKLARVAQDAAVLSGQNSTDVASQLTYAISTQNTEVARSAGININANLAYKDMAKQLHKSVAELTPAQKQQAFLNAVMQQGTAIAGTYEKAMETPSKVLRSFPRLLNDIAVSFGTPLLNGFGGAILAAYNFTKTFDKMVSDGGKLHPFVVQLGQAFGRLALPLTQLINKATVWLTKLDPSKIKPFVDQVAKMAKPIAAVAAALATFAGKNILGGLPGLGPILNALTGPLGIVVALIGVLMTTAEGRKAIQDLVNAFIPLVPVLADTVTQLAGMLPLLIPIVVQVVDFAAAAIELVTPLLQWLDAMKLILPILTSIAVVMVTLKVISTINKLLVTMGLAWEVALGPIGWIILAIIAVVAGLVIFYKTSATFRGIVNGVFNAVWGTIKVVINWIVNVAWPAVTGFFAAIASAVVTAWGYIAGAFTTVVGVLTAVFRVIITIFNAITLPFRIAVLLIIALAIWWVQTLWAIIQPPLNAIVAFVQTVVGWIVTAFHRFWEILTFVIGVYIALWRAIIIYAARIFSTIAGWVSNVWSKITSVLSPIVGFVTGLFSKIWSGITGWISRISSAVATVVSNITGPILGVVSTLASVGGDIVRGIWNGITGLGGWFLSKITGFIKDHVPGPIRHLLGISSPSKVMAAIGVQTAQGLAIGLTSQGPAVQSAAEGLLTPPSYGLGATVGAAAGVQAGGLPLSVKVYIGDTELTNIVKVIVNDNVSGQARTLAYGQVG